MPPLFYLLISIHTPIERYTACMFLDTSATLSKTCHLSIFYLSLHVYFIDVPVALSKIYITFTSRHEIYAMLFIDVSATLSKIHANISYLSIRMYFVDMPAALSKILYYSHKPTHLSAIYF